MCRVAITPPLPPLTTHTPLCPPCQERKRKVAGDVPGGDQPDKPAKTSGSSAQQVSEGLRWGGLRCGGCSRCEGLRCGRCRQASAASVRGTGTDRGTKGGQLCTSGEWGSIGGTPLVGQPFICRLGSDPAAGSTFACLPNHMMEATLA